jgi:hypothetical protein
MVVVFSASALVSWPLLKSFFRYGFFFIWVWAAFCIIITV